MCGRYYSRYEKQEIADRMHTRVDIDIHPSYNVAPTSFQPIVRLDRDGQREAAMLRWGLIPSWSKDAKIAFSTINARAETVATAPAFREAFKRRRVLVPASGFYEWKKLDPKTKQPHAITALEDGPIAFAGIAERWRDPATGQDLETYSIITTEPNELTAQVHSRMPVILAPVDYERWLDPGDPQRPPIDLLRPYPAEKMKMWPVHTDVGNVRNNHPDLINEVSNNARPLLY